MGRPRKQIDEVALLKLRGEGKSLKEISKEMGVSIPTLSRRLAVLNHEGVFTKYRQLQGLQLTELQAALLEAISPERIQSASLVEIMKAYHVLCKAQEALQGKESIRSSGLVDHLLSLERSDDG